ncbi:MAG: hypothetical protein KCHDKBKB_02304 [Elusimicrobia bacterium]|nr:hypothetical protein [Elusimicrobiota bacterium]
MAFSIRKKVIGSKEISFLICEPLEKAGFVHAFGTRTCPASHPNHLLSALNTTPSYLRLAKQIHSDIRLMVDHIPPGEGDALITQRTRSFVGVKTADCVPVLVADIKTRVVAAIHAGWRGTHLRIAEKTIHDLKKHWGVHPKNCIAAIGPSACGRCYEIGPDVVGKFRKEFFEEAESFISETSQKTAFMDTSKANAQQLMNTGLLPNNIYLSSHCTMHQNQFFFSHRKEGKHNPTLGRQLSVIASVG